MVGFDRIGSYIEHLTDSGKSGDLKISRSKAGNENFPKRDRAMRLLLLESPRQKHLRVPLHFHLKESVDNIIDTAITVIAILHLHDSDQDDVNNAPQD